MSKKIYGIPVATPLNPSKIAGTPGKSAHQYAKEAGYTGTEEEFAEKLAQEYPTKVSQLQNDSGYITSKDIPASSGSGIHIGSEPPEDENVTVWIDTDEEPEASGGDVTAEVGQTIVVEEVDESGKPTKWKAMDYQPRTHYKEICEILPPTKLEIMDDGYFLYPEGLTIEDGKTYWLTWNGTTYESVAFLCEGIVCLGNTLALEGKDTGEPFFIVAGGDEKVIASLEVILDITISVKTEIYYPLERAYLPKFGYVVSVTEEEAKKDTVNGETTYTIQKEYDVSELAGALKRGEPVWLQIIGEGYMQYLAAKTCNLSGWYETGYSVVAIHAENACATPSTYWHVLLSSTT